MHAILFRVLNYSELRQFSKDSKNRNRKNPLDVVESVVNYFGFTHLVQFSISNWYSPLQIMRSFILIRLNSCLGNSQIRGAELEPNWGFFFFGSNNSKKHEARAAPQ